MEKLFYKNQYIKEFTANIIEIKEVNNKFHVVLDKTAFFPGGGGQFCDLGEIDNIEVINVYEENKKIYHVLNNKPENNVVNASINWNRREDGMHQHFAQHVLSGCFYTKYNANTTGFHLGKEFSTVDIKGYLSEEQIREVEKYANEIISQDIPLTILTPSKDELENIWIRRDLPDTDDEIRIVRIGELDTNACCGVHPKSTKELRLIKIKRWEKNRQSTRIEFLAGKRAIDYVLRRDVYLSNICKYLKSKEDEALTGIVNLNDKIDELKNTIKKLENTVSKYQLEEIINNGYKINDLLIVEKIFENEDVKYINKLANKLVENKNTIALLCIKNKDKINLVFASSINIKNIKMNDLLKEVLNQVDGKGGGSNNLAQGAINYTDNIEIYIKGVIENIKGLL